MELRTTFDANQSMELYKALGKGLKNSEIAKHPEWSASLMGLYTDYEKQGKTEVMDSVIGFYKNNPCVLDVKEKSYGNDKDLCICLCSFIESGYSLKDIIIEKDSNGLVNEYRLYYELKKFMVQKNEFLKYNETGRLELSKNFFSAPVMFGEGIKEAYNIVSSLQGINADIIQKQELKVNPSRSADFLSSRSWGMSNVLQSLDDMNIRGTQVIYANDYVNGDLDKLNRLLHRRDKDLVDYINMRSAKELKSRIDGKGKDSSFGLSLFVPKAVVGDVSFHKMEIYVDDIILKSSNSVMELAHTLHSEWFIDESNYKEFIKEIDSLEVDYSNIDIDRHTNTEIGLGVLFNRGFEIVHDYITNYDYFGKREPYRSIILYNKKTGDYVHAGGAKEDSFCYNGLKLIAWRAQRNYSVMCSSGFDEDANAFRLEISYNDGLFSKYNKIGTPDKDPSIHWDKIKFGSSSIPIPQYFVNYDLGRRDLEGRVNKDNARLYTDDMYPYHLKGIINYLIAVVDPTIDIKVCPAYNRLKKDWKTVGYNLLLWGIGSYNDSENLMLLGDACNFLNVSDNIRSELFKGILKYCKAFDNKLVHKDYRREGSMWEVYDSRKEDLFRKTNVEDVKLVIKGDIEDLPEEVKNGLSWENT